MLSWMKGLLRRSDSSMSPPDLPVLERADVKHLWHAPEGFPRVNWDMADGWIGRRQTLKWSRDGNRRAIMGCCLDELRDGLDSAHDRWRSARVEGLAPSEGNTPSSLARAAERSLTLLTRDLKMIRGEASIPPVAIVALAPLGTYLDFTGSYFPAVGNFATSGGLYLNDGRGDFPLIAVNLASRGGAENTLAHELTHHALHHCELPLWVEEGFTQMMEERIVGPHNFTLDHELVERHRDLWDDAAINRFIKGDMFLSPVEDHQELAYHLSQWVVRGELTRRPKDFFAFARACRDQSSWEACTEHLGMTPHELIANTVHP